MSQRGLELAHLLARAAQPQVMGVLNVTPDSFSDGGEFLALEAALAQGRALLEGGAAVIDVGGESTRPGAAPVPPSEEEARVVPVISALRAAHPEAVISIDTRRAQVAAAALAAGADLVNDVSGLEDPEMIAVCAAHSAPLILGHIQGLPETMQDDPSYEDVVSEVCAALEAGAARARAAGVSVLVDPGIGFGKTLAHNLALIRRLSLFHTLGCPILLGVSRKRFIGTLSGVAEAGQRVAGSIAAGLEGLAQGAQVLRVHDVAETRQAIGVWQALREGAAP